MTDFDAAQLPALCDSAMRDLDAAGTIHEFLKIRNAMEEARIYAAKHKMPNEAQAIVIRAVIIAERRIGQELNVMDRLRSSRLAAWRAEAALYADERECEVCGQWLGFTHAHHVYPLAWQADDGRIYADHTIAWLCPNHHAAVHVLLNTMDLGRVVRAADNPEHFARLFVLFQRGRKMRSSLQ